MKWDRTKASGKNRDNIIQNYPARLRILRFNNNAVDWKPTDPENVKSIIANINFLETFFPQLNKIDYDFNKF